MAGRLVRRCATAMALLVLVAPAHLVAPAEAASPLPRPKPAAARTAVKHAEAAVVPVSLEASEPAPRAGPTLLSASDAALYRQAFAKVDAGDWTQAVALATKAREKLPGKIILWSWLAAKNSGATFEEITAFIDANPDWPRLQTLMRRAEEAITDATPADVQRAWFKRNPPVSAIGHMRLGEALIAAGDVEAGTAAIRAAYADPDLTEDDERAVLARDGRLLRPEDHRARLDALLWEGDTEGARRVVSRVDGDWAALARARIALRQSTGGAEAAFAAVPPSLAKDPGLLYERARWLRLKDRDLEAEQLLLSLTPEAIAVRPDKWWTERRIEARKRLKDGAISDAYKLTRNHGMTDGTGFAEAEFLAGWIALRFLGDPAMAYEHFTSLHQAARYSVTLARGAYWAGRAAEAMGDAAKAKRWYGNAAQYGTTFYGQLAAHEAGDEAALRLPRDPVPTAADRAAFGRQELVRAARMLGQIDEGDRLRPFIQQLNANAMKPVDRQLAADLAAELDRDDLAVAAAKDADRAGVPLIARGWPLLRVPKTAPEPALVLALTRQESAFDHRAVSGAGARGLMQLMPGTAKIVAKQLKVKFDAKRLTTDPGYNMMLGAAHLDDLVGGYGGSYVMALAAYNAGPGRVSQWVREYGDPRASDVDVVDWIESIPFDETRNYVQRVMENVQVYRQRLARDKVVPLRLAEDLQRAAAPRQQAAQRAPLAPAGQAPVTAPVTTPTTPVTTPVPAIVPVPAPSIAPPPIATPG
jgi:soluble lytic murein transglycosylase